MLIGVSVRVGLGVALLVVEVVEGRRGREEGKVAVEGKSSFVLRRMMARVRRICVWLARCIRGIVRIVLLIVRVVFSGGGLSLDDMVSSSSMIKFLEVIKSQIKFLMNLCHEHASMTSPTWHRHDLSESCRFYAKPSPYHTTDSPTPESSNPHRRVHDSKSDADGER